MMREDKARQKGREIGLEVMVPMSWLNFILFVCLFLFFHTLGDEVCGSNAYFIEFHTSSVTLAK